MQQVCSVQCRPLVSTDLTVTVRGLMATAAGESAAAAEGDTEELNRIRTRHVYAQRKQRMLDRLQQQQVSRRSISL